MNINKMNIKALQPRYAINIKREEPTPVDTNDPLVGRVFQYKTRKGELKNYVIRSYLPSSGMHRVVRWGARRSKGKDVFLNDLFNLRWIDKAKKDTESAKPNRWLSSDVSIGTESRALIASDDLSIHKRSRATPNSDDNSIRKKPRRTLVSDDNSTLGKTSISDDVSITKETKTTTSALDHNSIEKETKVISTASDDMNKNEAKAISSASDDVSIRRRTRSTTSASDDVSIRSRTRSTTSASDDDVSIRRRTRSTTSASDDVSIRRRTRSTTSASDDDVSIRRRTRSTTSASDDVSIRRKTRAKTPPSAHNATHRKSSSASDDVPKNTDSEIHPNKPCRVYCENPSKYYGISRLSRWSKGKWRARCARKPFVDSFGSAVIGIFDREIDAAKAYDDAIRKHAFTPSVLRTLNFPTKAEQDQMVAEALSLKAGKMISGYNGVTRKIRLGGKSKKQWRARCGRQSFLEKFGRDEIGWFYTALEAAKAYDAAMRKCDNSLVTLNALNFPTPAEQRRLENPPQKYLEESRKKGISIYKGVSMKVANSKLWRARCGRKDYKAPTGTRTIGQFESQVDAAKAHDDAIRKYCTITNLAELNFPTPEEREILGRTGILEPRNTDGTNNKDDSYASAEGDDEEEDS